MAQERLTNEKVRTKLHNQKLFKQRFKNHLSNIDAEIDSIANASTKTAVARIAKMVKILGRYAFAEADGE